MSGISYYGHGRFRIFGYIIPGGTSGARRNAYIVLRRLMMTSDGRAMVWP